MKAFILLMLVAVNAAAQTVPQLLNYQGRVEVQGTNFTGTGNFKFALVNAAGTTNLWSNDGTPVGQPAGSVGLTVVNGLYSVLLGSTTPIPPAIFTNQNVYLRVWFNDGIRGLQQLAPDQQLVSVGYAMMADSAATAPPTNQLRFVTSGGTLATLTLTAGSFFITNRWVNGALGDYGVIYTGSEEHYFDSPNKSSFNINLTAPEYIQLNAGSSFPTAFFEFTDKTGSAMRWNVFADNRPSGTQEYFRVSSRATNGAGLVIFDNNESSKDGIFGWQHAPAPGFGAGLVLQSSNRPPTPISTPYPPHINEDYVRFQNYASADLGGVTVGSNYTAFIVGRGTGIGTADREFPTNRWAGFVFGRQGTAQSNQIFIALRDQTNGLWCLGIDTNGVLGAYRTNNLATPVTTY